MEGWIDTRILLPTGEHILVDYMSFPGADPVAQIRDHYLSQMETYAWALATKAGKPVQSLVRLPLLGLVVQVFHDRADKPDASGEVVNKAVTDD